MADSKIVTKLDEKLIEKGIIDSVYKDDLKKVHTMLNTHVRKNGKILTEETFKKGDEKLRDWLMLLYKKGASQEKLTAYLRCGLAHLSFDFIESAYKTIATDDLITRALQSLRKRNYHKAFFKVSSSKLEKPRKVKAVKKKSTKKVIKKATKKKTSLKKTSAKTKKKTSTKKSVKSKTAVKKKVVKKAASKKTNAKKKTVKKTTVKKPAQKKNNKKKSFLAKILKK